MATTVTTRSKTKRTISSQHRHSSLWVFTTLLLFMVGAITPNSATGQVFPFITGDAAPLEQADNEYLSTLEWREGSTEGWFPFPFVHWQRAEDYRFTALHPLFSSTQNDNIGVYKTDIAWPLIRWHHRQAPVTRDRTTLRAFFIWFSGFGERDGVRFNDQFLAPFYWRGGQETGEKYFILFPFVWYADEARVLFPLFPSRPQRIAALWPIAGYFDGFWNRDSIKFVLWPLFVQSTKHQPEHPDRVVTTSFPWPFIAVHTGPNVSGFRVWPLFSRVSRENEFTRAYWLWPLGQYRSEQPSARYPEGRDLAVFVPFYARWRDHRLDFRLYFPFYGDLEMRGRRSRGWLLGSYTENDRLRSGVREHRLLWFIFRWTSDIEVPEHFIDDVTGQSQLPPRKGGGVFPFYIRYETPDTMSINYLWPFGRRYITNEFTQEGDLNFRFRRSYLFPFYAGQMKDHTNPDLFPDRRYYYFPAMRRIQRPDGWQYQSAPHLWPYLELDFLDRNYAPLWTVWSKEENAATNEMKVRVLGNVWQNDRFENGAERKRLDLFLFRAERSRNAEGERGHSTRLLFGAVEHRREPGERQRLRLFGKAL